jgi:hypothetical protein
MPNADSDAPGLASLLDGNTTVDLIPVLASHGLQ